MYVNVDISAHACFDNTCISALVIVLGGKHVDSLRHAELDYLGFLWKSLKSNNAMVETYLNLN